MTAVLFLYALGLSAVIAFTGVVVMFLAEVPGEGEEVIPWSELDAEGMTEDEIEAKIKEGFARKKLYGLDRYKYQFGGKTFPSVFIEQFFEMFIPCFLVALVMVYITKHVE